VRHIAITFPYWESGPGQIQPGKCVAAIHEISLGSLRETFGQVMSWCFPTNQLRWLCVGELWVAMQLVDKGSSHFTISNLQNTPCHLLFAKQYQLLPLATSKHRKVAMAKMIRIVLLAVIHFLDTLVVAEPAINIKPWFHCSIFGANGHNDIVEMTHVIITSSGILFLLGTRLYIFKPKANPS
jgi:hypothetical protein